MIIFFDRTLKGASNSKLRGLKFHTFADLTPTAPLPIILVKSTMVQSTSANNIGQDLYTNIIEFER